MSTETEDVDRFIQRPTIISSVIAVVVATTAVALLSGSGLQRQLLALALIGSVSFGAGSRLRGKAHRVTGTVLMLLGALLVVVAIGLVLLGPLRFSSRVELVPSMVGLWVFIAALGPVWSRWTRWLINLGVGLLFAGILLSGMLRSTPSTALVAAAAATILAWDTARNGVSIGTQIGAAESAATERAELTHIGASSTVAIAAIGAVVGVSRLNIENLHLATLIAVLIAGISFSLVLTHQQPR